MLSDIITFFCISRRKYCFDQIFDYGFLMDLHVLGCPEHDLTISGKMFLCLSMCLYVCVCVYAKNFVASVARELMHRIS